jgi:hypothetical protein
MRIIEFEGRVHLVSPLGGSQHTICGVACDTADSEGDESLRWVKTARSKFSCEQCAAVIDACARSRPLLKRTTRTTRRKVMARLLWDTFRSLNWYRGECRKTFDELGIPSQNMWGHVADAVLQETDRAPRKNTREKNHE